MQHGRASVEAEEEEVEEEMGVHTEARVTEKSRLGGEPPHRPGLLGSRVGVRDPQRGVAVAGGCRVEVEADLRAAIMKESGVVVEDIREA